MDNFGYRIESKKPFDKVCADLEKATADNQFRMLAVHDVKATLADKGFEREPLKIFEMCNAGFAHQALQKEIQVAMFMPCRITVHPEGSKTVMTLARPTVISQMLPDAGLDDLAGEVEKKLIKVMEIVSA